MDKNNSLVKIVDQKKSKVKLKHKTVVVKEIKKDNDFPVIIYLFFFLVFMVFLVIYLFL